MKQLPWLRLYTEIIDDEKLGLLAFEDRWHFVALLCLKGKGVLDSEPDIEMLHRKAALKMGLTVTELEKVVARLSRMGLVDKDTLQPAAWDSRQMQSDSSSDRVRAYRERIKKPKSDCNVSVTAQELDTDTDTDTDKEEDKTKKKRVAAPTFPLPEWINQSHWNAWHSCAKRKNATPEQKQLAVEKLDAWRQQGVDHASALENAAVAGWQGLFKPDDKRSPAGNAGNRRTPPPDKFNAASYGQGGKL